jgi:hypothetical protein
MIVTIGDLPIALNPTSTSPAPMTFTSSDPDVASIVTIDADSATLVIESPGSAVITVSQPAVDGFAAITRTLTVTVGRRAQAPLAVTTTAGLVGTPLTLATSGGTGSGAVTFALGDTGSDDCTLDADQLSRSTVGTCTVTATKAGDTTRLPVTSLETTVTFLIDPTLDLPATISTTFGSAAITLNLTSTSPAPMTYASSATAVATVTRIDDDSFRISLIGAGEATITVSQVATGDYAAVTRTAALTIAKRAQSTLNVTSTSGLVGTELTLTTSGGTGSGAVTFALGSAAASECTLVANRLSRSVPGTCPVIATKATDANNLAASSAETTVTFRLDPALTVPASLAATVGDSPITIDVTSNSPAPITFTSGNNGVVTVTKIDDDSASVTIVGGGTATITVAQAAIGDYASASRGIAVTVARLTQDELVVTSTEGVVDVPLALTTTGGSGTGAVSYALSGTNSPDCSVSSGRLTRTSAGPCTVLATKAQDSQHLARTSAATTVDFEVVNFPTAVTDLTTTVNDTTVDLTWTVATSTDRPLLGHRVRYRTTDSNAGWVDLPLLAAESTSGSITGLAAGRTYDIEVAGVNSRGAGDAATASVTIAGTAATQVEIVPTACALIIGSSPSGEQCQNALLHPGRTSTAKYLNFEETANQVWVDLGAAYRLTQFQIYTANSAQRDPEEFLVYAANGSSASAGTGALIASGTGSCPNIRNNPCTVFTLTPTAAHRYIVIQFPRVRFPGNFMEMSRIILHGIAQ